jgi:hypothetical protein
MHKKRKRYNKPAKESYEKRYFFLTCAEEQRYRDASVLSSKEQIEKLEQEHELLKTDFWADKTSMYFELRSFVILYHPELTELEKDPEYIKDPNDVFSQWSFGQPQVTRPKTNADRIQTLLQEWRWEYSKTPEYQYWNKLTNKMSSIRKEISFLQNKIKNVESIMESIKRGSMELYPGAYEVIDSLLIKKEDEDNEEKSSEKSGVKALLLPYTMDGIKWEAVTLARYRGTDYEPFEVFSITKGNSRFNEVLAVIHKGEIFFRNTKYENSIMESLGYLAKDPKEYFSTFGKKLGSCLLCGKTLSNEFSREMGFGPVCAGYLGKWRKTV